MKPISEQTVSRRSVLEWLGSGAVLALGADLLAACAVTDREARVDTGAGGADGPGPGGSDGRDAPDSGADFGFRPGPMEHRVYSKWGERTVDPQDLEEILSTWQLRVDGMADRPLTLGFADLLELPRRDQTTDFHCVEGWSVLDVPWNGVHLGELLDRAEPRSSATHVTIHTIGGTYNESLPLTVAHEPRTLLGYGIAGSTLPLKHGFPLRVVVPRLLGYKNAKYVARLELTDHPVEGYWVKAGYPYAGEVPEGRLRAGKY
jgi:hypothetical protein